MILIEQPLIIVFKAFKEIKEISHLQTYAAKSLQLCQTLCDPIDSSPPGSPVPGILQARTLEWVAISFSKPKLKLPKLTESTGLPKSKFLLLILTTVR